MKIGIHYSKGSFSERWIEYCDKNQIPWKKVDCYRNDIIEQLSDCEALMWHIDQGNPKDNLFAKQLIFSVQSSGKKVFPDFHTCWHFDDKVGQKYLLEANGAPLADTWVFYSKQSALEWIRIADFPKVFKLRGGAGSQNVRLVRSKRTALRLIRKAFSRGFSGYQAWGSLKERWRKFRLGKTNFLDLIKGILRLASPPPYARINGREKGYIYFQEFVPDNTFDIRIVVVGDRAFGLKRMVREGDFRASGSGMILYEKEYFTDETIRLSFEMATKLNTQSAAFDFVYSGERIIVVEVSFGYAMEAYDFCEGYWDKDLEWHEGQFDFCGWMVDLVTSDN